MIIKDMQVIHMKLPLLKSKNIKQLFDAYRFIVIAIMLLLSIALINEAQKSILNFSRLHAQKNCEVLETSINQVAAQFESAFLLLQLDDSCSQVMQASSYSQLTPEYIKDFKNAVYTKTDLSFLKDVAFTSDLISVSNLYLPDELKRMSDIMPSGRSMISLGIKTPQISFDKSYLCFGYNYYLHGEKIGNIFFSLDIDQLISSLPISEQDGMYFALADSNHNVDFLIASDESDETLTQIKELLLKSDTENQTFFGIYQKYVIHSVNLKRIDCTLYSVIDTRTINTNLDSMYIFSLAMLIILLGITTLGNAFFHQSLVVPLNGFSQYISQLRRIPNVLQQTVAPLTISGCKEIQHIEKEFSALLESLSALTAEIQKKNEDLHQEELLRKDVEIKHLRSQINPHFLYNTLELIRADAIAGKIDQVSSITASMGKFYRYSIKGSPIVTLSEELEYVRAYLNIQQQRFEGRITIIYNISGDANFVRIPKMILQPLVENAIVHGLEPSGENACTLFIGAAQSDDLLTLSVRDNGIGIDSFHLKDLKEQLESPHADNDKIGLANVAARLRLQYGSSCRFDISSAPGDGTCITLQLPIVYNTQNYE